MIQDVLSSSAANPPIRNEMKGKILLAISRWDGSG
jgi:hypothetical protein